MEAKTSEVEQFLLSQRCIQFCAYFCQFDAVGPAWLQTKVGWLAVRRE